MSEPAGTGQPGVSASVKFFNDGSGSFIDTGLGVVGRSVFTVAVKFSTTSNTTGANFWNDPSVYNLALNGFGYDGGITVHNGYAAFWFGTNASNGDINAVSSILVNDGAMHTIVWTCDGYNMRLYVDGSSASIDQTTSHWSWYGMRAGITAVASSVLTRLAPWLGRVNTSDFDGWNGQDWPTGGGSNYGGQSAMTFAKLKCFAYPLTSAQVAALVL
jgi:hypothetical protein